MAVTRSHARLVEFAARAWETAAVLTETVDGELYEDMSDEEEELLKAHMREIIAPFLRKQAARARELQLPVSKPCKKTKT